MVKKMNDFKPPVVSDDYDIPLNSDKEFLAWFNGLSPKEQDEWKKAASHSPLWSLNEGTQSTAFHSKADILGFGGAAGGSKSALLILLAVYSHTRSVIFRHQATQMSGLIDDMIECLGTQEGLTRQGKRWYIPSGRPGHLVEWSGLSDEISVMAQRGIAHDFIGFDEVTEIEEKRVRFVQTWLRSSKANQRTRIVMTFNPPSTTEGRWVIDYFAPWIDERHENPAQPGELRWFITDENGDDKEVESNKPVKMKLGDREAEVYPKSRTFIPSTVFDNPFLMSNNFYLGTLQSLEEPLRSQMLLGDFRSGVMDDEWQVLPTEWIDLAMDRWDQEGRKRLMTGMGVDVARGGRDNTVLARRHGYWWDEIIRRRGSQTGSGQDVAGLCMTYLRNGATILIDSQSVGASPYDLLRASSVDIKGIPAQGRSEGRPCGSAWSFYNLRAEMWWRLRCVLNPDNNFLPSLPKDNRLRSELLTPRWEMINGKVKIQSKDEIRERLGRSTDEGDAICLSLMNMDKDGSNDGNWRRTKKVDLTKRKDTEIYSDDDSWMSV